MKALIVEDCEDLRLVLSILLKTKGFSVQEFPNGKEALSAMMGEESHYDLLLTDFNMPIMNGLELIEEVIKLNIQIKRIVVLSGIANNEYKLKNILNQYKQH